MLISLERCVQNKFLQSENVQLSKPVISLSEVFFEDTTTMSISDTQEDAVVVCVYNGTVTADYLGPKNFLESFTMSATAFGEDYITSEAATIVGVKLPNQSILSINSDRLPSEKYNTGGLDILIDRKKGEVDFNKGWLGYGGDTISYNLKIEERNVSMVKVSALRDQKSWIFAPSKVQVYHDGILLAMIEVEESLVEQDLGNVIVTIPLERITLDNLEVKIIAPTSLPTWHPGAGSKPWIFIDEILIY